ncbi:hypothetical protein BCV69DRAFT_314171 [Microstroma glucosiphilum]|uniref:Pre-rRNA-processing protein RIX1 N-terminal domain-containing protein n=1 Tax=Pseudomicrostroma glucosiphilum TaxID=1684307 RepID=A0A316U106_9BASI|nr:hypothetical protein BCV69DRAFT_314171 [Pseudomicrostroma glucosiphilum]PWN18977.1 hypothetical protein BCV69DRAFT_314171 [Pseudomicrostroma glucosiphilum]
MAFQYIGLGGPGGAAVDGAEVYARQLNVLVSSLDQAATASPPALERISSTILALRSTQLLNLLTRYTDAGSESATQALRKTALKTGSLVTAHPTRAAHLTAGFSLALEIAEQSGWAAEDGLLRYGQDWLSAGITYLTVTSGQAPPSASTAGQQVKADAAVLRPLLALVTEYILSPAAASRPEFARAVVTPNLPKVAGVLVASVEAIVKRSNGFMNAEDEASLICLLAVLARQLQVHPSILRPFVSRLHAASTPLLVAPSAPSALVQAATNLVGHLYLTGAQSNTSTRAKELNASASGGKATQAQLWLATIKAAIGSTKSAWEASVSTLELGEESASQGAGLPFAALPDEPYQAQSEALQHLNRLLGTGQGKDAGVLLHLLQIPTSRAVAMPLSALTSLARSMLSATADSPARSAIDATLHATQLAALPQLHLQAFRLLLVTVRLAQGAGTAATARLGPHWLEMAIRPLERGVRSPPPVRAAASRLLVLLVSDATVAVQSSSRGLPSFRAGCALPLDPVARITLRGAKACLSEIARLLSPDEEALSMEPSQSAQSGGSSRKKKRSRMYESDALFSGSSPKVLGLKQLDEQASALACLEALPFFFPHMCTSLTPMHYDIAHTTAQVVAALAEVTLRQPAPTDGGIESSRRWEDLASGSLSSLAKMIRVASGPILGLLSPRLTDLATFALGVVGPTQPLVTRAAHEALAALREVSLPSLPPVLAAKVQEEGDDAEEELAQVSKEWGTDPHTGKDMLSKTGQFVQDVGGEVRKMKEAVKDVVGLNLDASSRKRQSSVDEGDEEDADEDEEMRPPPHMHGSPQAYNGPRHSSPSRATEDTDPVKPRHRPSTPRIGSPTRVVSTGSHIAGGVGGSPGAREVFGSGGLGGAGSPSRRVVSSPSLRKAELPSSSADSASVLQPTPTLVSGPAGDAGGRVTTTTEVTTVRKPAEVELRIESDDEEMPEIDINSSDEDE